MRFGFEYVTQLVKEGGGGGRKMERAKEGTESFLFK